MATLLFVYGSLKRGFAHHTQMDGATFEGEASTVAGFCLCRVGTYPALVRTSEGSVRGEVYRVSSSHLEQLDAFEGCPTLYRRELIELGDGRRVASYLMTAAAVADCPRLPGGEWTRAHQADADP